jgi:integrase
VSARGTGSCSRFVYDTRRRRNRTPYALRHTYATSSLAAGVPALDVARYMGTSLAMLDATYGHLVKGSEEFARARMDAFAADRLRHYRGTDAANEESG